MAIAVEKAGKFEVLMNVERRLAVTLSRLVGLAGGMEKQEEYSSFSTRPATPVVSSGWCEGRVVRALSPARTPFPSASAKADSPANPKSDSRKDQMEVFGGTVA